jgi:hypothetical protein
VLSGTLRGREPMCLFFGTKIETFIQWAESVIRCPSSSGQVPHLPVQFSKPSVTHNQEVLKW